MASEARFRREQTQLIEGYRGGKVGVAAVPGSGKTFTLSHLAARLVERLTAGGGLAERQEVLIVTFTNSAVNSFRSRIASILGQQRGLLPSVGYRVRTLHSLAQEIVRERPSLVGLAEDFQIMDERQAQDILRDVARSLFGSYLEMFSAYLDPQAAPGEGQARRIEQQELPELAVEIAQRFVKHAKDNLLDPASLRARLATTAMGLPLVRFGLAVYEDYQRSLSYRGAVDFDDLVRLAILALETDEAYCARLRQRWPYILEDEAQDSSWLQERMLRLLSNEQNWVRVGDSNQAINTTFTTADPSFLRKFLRERGVERMPLYTSGRSTRPIIGLANALVRWTSRHHPVPWLRTAAFDADQEIRPTDPDDPQPNPSERNATLYIHYQQGKNVSPEAEIEMVAASIERLLEDEKNQRLTVAALAPANSRAFKLTEILRARGVAYDDGLLRSSTAVRQAAAALRTVLDYLGHPLNTAALVRLYRDVWWALGFCLFDEDDWTDAARDAISRVLAGCRHVETFLWPTPGADWLEEVSALAEQPLALNDLDAFRAQVQVWLRATTLPIDQLVLTVTQDLFTEPSDIALGHKIAVLLRAATRSNPDWRLPEFAEELRVISENQRRFLGFDDVEYGYEPKTGQVTVSTMHGAKGLEWDRVYLLGVSNYDFPSVQANDNYVSEKWYVRDSLNLETEALAQLDALLNERPYREGEATEQARLDYAAERLRLLYVGITRAKRDLIITWNMGRFWRHGGEFINQPALPLVALAEYLDGTAQI